MARPWRKKEPWEVEPSGGAAGGSTATPSGSPVASGGASGGGSIRLPGGHGTTQNNNVLHNVQNDHVTHAVAVTDNTLAISQATREPISAVPAVTASSGNSGGHFATVKTNYTKGTMAGGKASASAGYGDSHGRSTAENAVKTTATKAVASGNYQNRDSGLSEEQRVNKEVAEVERGEKLSNTYNSDGERMTRIEFKAYQTDLKEADIQGMRRIVISPDPVLGISEQEMVSITRDAMWSWAEKSGKNFEFSFAVHDGQSVIHSHVCMHSENANDVNMASKQLEAFKSLIDQAIETQLEQREELGEDSSFGVGEDITQGEDENENLVDDKDNQDVQNIDDGVDSGGGGGGGEAAEEEELVMAL